MLFQSEIGTAKDNLVSPIHNWYKFTAGFSHKLIAELAKSEGIHESDSIFDPFAGCGTTLVSAQKLGIKAVGNEAQSFMHEVISAKLDWSYDRKVTLLMLAEVIEELRLFNVSNKGMDGIHPLLATLYSEVDLLELYFLRNYIMSNVEEKKYQLLFKLALSQTLHKISIFPIAAPYINRGKAKERGKDPVSVVFSSIVISMCNDLDTLPHRESTAKVYLQDSRKENPLIKSNSCSYCITSPPYLNNLDYGEVSKVHTHFFNITNNWNDITTNVRKKLVTGSTTHYKKSDFEFDVWKAKMPFITNPELEQELTNLYSSIERIGATKTGKKSFHVLMCFYFYDMMLVLQEIKRVLNDNGKAFLVLGDSAPYGTFVPTTHIIGQLALSVGFKNFSISKLRDRGTKWKSLKYRHSMDVAENILKIW